MKRILSRTGLCLMLAALVLLAAGCSDKYYNGSVSVLSVTDTERAKLEAASEEVAKILQLGTAENLLDLLPDQHTAEQEQDVKDGWTQWEQVHEQYGDITGQEIKDVFLYHYIGAVTAAYSFGDTVIWSDMLYTNNFNLIYLDFYVSAETDEDRKSTRLNSSHAT